ncbi:protein transporter tim9 [Spiromyces aspiralis]|uniref:Protein transporter tim9 n=1 Tax=Spiromyces aspiralis TaxID=68401 RepID=A0ACC1HGS7_9FUNG|nr:protein transporter tim9 [Spiromyces aspiralis]
MFGGYQPSFEQQRMQALVEQKQMKDFMRLYSTLVSRCFDDCVHDFNSKVLSENETSCVNKCTLKFMKMNERIGQRFAEENQKLMEEQAKQSR